MSEPLSFVVLGAGGIARKAYLPLLRAWPNTRLTGIYSRTLETLKPVCAEWQIDFGTTDLQALIDLKPKAAFVLAATEVHFELIKMLLEAGIDVFSEKPSTTSSASAYELANLAKEKGRIFMVGFNRRFALLFQQARQLFGSRKPQMIIVEKHRPQPVFVQPYWNTLQDTIHQVDLMRYFGGEAAPGFTQFEVKDGQVLGMTAQVALPQGGLGLIVSSLQAGAWSERVTLMGEGLTIEVNAFRELRVRYADHDEVFGVDRPGKWLPELRERGFEGQIAHFLDCVQSRQTPQIDGFEAAHTQVLVEKIVTLGGAPLEDPGK